MEQHISNVNDSHDNKHITIRALRRGTRNVVSTLLNPIKIIPNDKGLPRDWQGLAELCGISGEKIPSLQHDPDPSNKVLTLWDEKDKNQSTVDKFITFLEELDRFDVIEDISPLIEEDIKHFKQNPTGFNNKYPDIETDILTIDDVNRISEGLEPQTYDAFVLFADDDIDFATELIETMEKQYNLKFCVKGRDLVGGGFEHDSMIKLISERCRRLIIILSPAFFESSANKFFYSFAQAIGIAQKKRKIVPCLYKPCGQLPAELSWYVVLDYERTKLWTNFWYKLYNSIRTPEERPAVAGDVNLVRPLSEEDNSSSPCSLVNPVSQRENVSPNNLRPPNQPKTKSLDDLNSIDSQKIVPNESMSGCNSANSLTTYTEKARSNTSFYKRIKKIIKVKSTKNDEAKSETPNLVTDVEINKTKEKKKNFFSRGNKRKVALAN